ncbi:MAG: DUF6186 family protein [Rhodoluna sp.]|nr:DUF6186 family protein [Rhodoluna sp.]
MTRWITIAGYLTFVVAGIAAWLITRRQDSKVASIGKLFDRVMHHRATRVAIMIAWWWVGWHFLVNTVGR